MKTKVNFGKIPLVKSVIFLEMIESVFLRDYMVLNFQLRGDNLKGSFLADLGPY
jgi:hypothetical protein